MNGDGVGVEGVGWRAVGGRGARVAGRVRKARCGGQALSEEHGPSRRLKAIFG